MGSAALVVDQLAVELAGRSVLQDVSCIAEYGRVLAVLGPNGAGKSTLLKACAGLLPYRGDVMLDGMPLERASVRERARKLSFVPQQSSLRSALTVHEVVSQGRYAHGQSLRRPARGDERAVRTALETCDVDRFAGRAFTALSFGEQRRVLLARGLATEARILCLDEPTASLDVAHALHLYALLRKLAHEGFAVVVVLHQLDDATKYADDVLLLSHGRCMGAGPTATVVSKEAVHEVYGVHMHRRGGLGFSLEAGTSCG